MKHLLYILTCFQCLGAGLLSMPGTLENITPSPIRGLVAYYSWDNANSLSNDVSYTSFTTLTEGSGTNHLTKVGNAGQSTNYLIGSGAAGFTNGVGDYWRIAAASAERMSQATSNYLTMMAWAYHIDNANSMGIGGKGQSGSSTTSWLLFLNGTANKAKSVSFQTSSNGSAQVTMSTGNILTSNTWRQFVIEFDGTVSNKSMWINLTNYSTQSAGTNTLFPATTRVFQIGASQNAAAQTFNGAIDDVGVWSGSRGGLPSCLTSNEIRFLANIDPATGLPRGRKFPFNSGSGP